MNARVASKECDRMDHRENTTVPRGRRPYEKPAIIEVELRPEEAVLGNCKTNGGGPGPFQGVCDSPAACNTIAS
jgi:hypothetical protein